MIRVAVDCSTGQVQRSDLTDAEVAVRQAAAAAGAAAIAAAAQRLAAQQAAINQLKGKARGGDTNSRLFLQALGIDPNAS